MDTRKHKIIYVIRLIFLLSSPSRWNTPYNYFFLQLEPLRCSIGEYDILSGKGYCKTNLYIQEF